jgi:TonB family protein
MMLRLKTRCIAVCAISLFAGCSRPPANPEVEAAVAAYDQEIAQLEQWRVKLSGADAGARVEPEKDFRGRTIDDDLKRWVLTPDTRREMKDLRERALASEYPADAKQLLAQAHRRADEDIVRAKSIWAYWNAHLPAPYWRRYWHELYSANGVTEENPDSMLVATEARLARSLDGGEFESAAKVADELNAILGEAMNRATDRIYHSREPVMEFMPRKTPCARESARPSGERAKLVRGESIDSFYPAEAIKRAERGSVVLRAKINAAGCATSVLVQVHSGVPSLDAAALSWFETASFTPASSHGAPIDSMLVWKVRFELRDDPG